MKIDVEKTAALARIEIRAEEKEKLQADLNSILDYVDQLQKLDTASVPPTSHVLDLENVYREDRENPQSVRDEVLKHAPAAEGHFFKVPKVVDR